MTPQGGIREQNNTNNQRPSWSITFTDTPTDCWHAGRQAARTILATDPTRGVPIGVEGVIGDGWSFGRVAAFLDGLAHTFYSEIARVSLTPDSSINGVRLNVWREHRGATREQLLIDLPADELREFEAVCAASKTDVTTALRAAIAAYVAEGTEPEKAPPPPLSVESYIVMLVDEDHFKAHHTTTFAAAVKAINKSLPHGYVMLQRGTPDANKVETFASLNGYPASIADDPLDDAVFEEACDDLLELKTG